MLTAHTGKENITGLKFDHFFKAGFAVVHVHCAIEYGEHLFAIINVPFVGLVGPVQSGRGSLHIGNIQRGPRAVTSEITAANYFHF